MSASGTTQAPPDGLDLFLITGMSGSGKSVALAALEDAGYYCVDNLPPELLESFVALQRERRATHVAVAIDVRSGVSLPQLPLQLEALRREGIRMRSLFLDATTDALVRRYSETRRRHPCRARTAASTCPSRSAPWCRRSSWSASCWPTCATAPT